jgi:hypothetical protein
MRLREIKSVETQPLSCGFRDIRQGFAGHLPAAGRHTSTVSKQYAETYNHLTSIEGFRSAALVNATTPGCVTRRAVVIAE